MGAGLRQGEADRVMAWLAAALLCALVGYTPAQGSVAEREALVARPNDQLPEVAGNRVHYFPHLAVGAGWQTTITYINYSRQEVTCQTDFISDDGSSLMVSFLGLGRVVSRTDVLPPGGSVHQETNVELITPLAPGWARATCSGPVKASLLFRRYNSEGVPTAEAGVNAAAVPATRFVTFAEQGEGQFGTGVAYANPSATAAVVTFTARDTAGQTLASTNHILPPRGHGAQNMVDLFGPTSFIGSLDVTSTEPIVSLSLNFEADPVFSSLPPGELDPSAEGSVTYYFPHLAVGASWQTTITYINYSSEEVSCQTDFLFDDGSPLMVSFTDLGRVVSRTDVLPPGRSVHQETNVDRSAPLAPGWARATCSGPVKASLLFRRYDSEEVPTGEATVNAAAVPATRFITFAEQGEGQFGTGVAYANPSSTAADLSFTARDATGQTLASVNHTLPPEGHGSHNMVDLFGLTSFSGSLEVTSTEPIVSLSLNFEADPVFSSLPPGGVEERIHDPGTEAMTDREALEVLYHATGGPNWRDSTHWLSDLPLSEWRGVRTDGNGQVTGLFLGGNQLSGRIPPALSQLSRLQVLNLGGNQLSEEIPPGLGSLTHLQWLDFSDNQLSGAIPPGLGELTNLQSLNLWRNELRGGIPPELGQLSRLQGLYLGYNRLSGAIPKILQQLSELALLNIRGTDVCILTDAAFQAWLGTINSFRSSGLVCDGTRQVLFSASSYEVREGETVTVLVRLIDQTGDPFRSAEIPLTAEPGGGVSAADYSEVPESVTIIAPLNEAAFVVEAIKDEFFDHGETVELGFRRPLPSGITAGDPETSRVTIHDLGTEGVTDREVLEALYHGTGGPAWKNNTHWMSALPLSEWSGVGTDESGRVTSLSLSHNWLSGTIPSALGQLSQLQVLDLGFNNLRGEIPPELGELTNLQVLDLGFNNLSGIIPPELGELIDLQVLDLNHNGLTGEIPAELAGLIDFQVLNLRANQLSGMIPPGLGELIDLQVLDLGINQLNGEIPVELAGLTNLKEMDLSGNELSGTIPPELGQMTNLQSLDLCCNELSGGIPAELGGLTNLKGMRLSGNRLSGRIPPELAGLAQLQWLLLNGNELSGAIPPELGRLTQLQGLNLWVNRLSGGIPPELAGLAQLQGLFLSYNELSGAIPPELGRLTQLQGLDLKANELSGAIPPELARPTNLQGLQLGFNPQLSGTLPPGLQQLPLTTLHLMGTSVCVPEDAELQEWLAMIERFTPSGLTCDRPPPAMSPIDILVVYTPAARRIAGGTTEIEAVIDLMIAEANQAYLDGGVNQRLVLVAREEVEYTEVGNRYSDLGRLASASDGHMDEVHAIRDRVGADLVHLITDKNALSAAFLVGAFGITSVRGGSGTFAHELGHNMGLSHDRYQDGGYGVLPYSYGYVNQQAFTDGAPESARWKTIMAYPNQCTDAGVRCDTIMRFSNSNQTYLGDPLGVPGDHRSRAVTGPTDAVRALNLMRHSVTAFRPRATGNQLTMSSTVSQPRPTVRATSQPPGLLPGDGLFRVLAPNQRGAASQQAGGVLDRATLRRREVSVDIQSLARVSRGGNTALRLNLFDDVDLTGIIERQTPTYSGGTALSGHLAGVPGGSVTLVVNGSVVAGTVRVPGATYRIRPGSAGSHVIMQIDPLQLPQRCGLVTRMTDQDQ